MTVLLEDKLCYQVLSHAHCASFFNFNVPNSKSVITYIKIIIIFNNTVVEFSYHLLELVKIKAIAQSVDTIHNVRQYTPMKQFL